MGSAMNVIDKAYEGIDFKDACKLMGGRLKDEGDLRVCQIKRGLESFLLVEKENKKVEVISESPRKMEEIAGLKELKDITCTVMFSDTGLPEATKCFFVGEDKKKPHAININIYPTTGITVHKYPIMNVKGMTVLSTIGDVKEWRAEINPSFRDIFSSIYLENAVSALADLESEER